MIKVVQFGEGNFLRTFADAYFHALNEEGGAYGVTVVQPIPMGDLGAFARQNNVYHIVLRGMENGKATESVTEVRSLIGAVSPFADGDAFFALARDPELKLIVSNTTEAGICYRETDAPDGMENVTFPAKLTRFLFERYKAGLPGVYLLPAELIDRNADALYACVKKYIALWKLPQGFAAWNEHENYYCNTLVDRIVSGRPRDEKTKAHVRELIGKEDELVSIGEPFGLWAIEKKGEIDKYIKEGRHNIDVVLTDDIAYYKKRKVRVLNGSHTNLVAAGLMLGKETVYDCMTDPKLSAFVSETLRQEIVPFVSADIRATTAFANSVKERFCNPYLDHRLQSIALNSISKWRARVLPSFTDYCRAHKKLPHNLTVGFSYLLALYYTQTEKQQDEQAVLDMFRAQTPVREILQNAELWGQDLTKFDGFAEEVGQNVRRITRGECLL